MFIAEECMLPSRRKTRCVNGGRAYVCMGAGGLTQLVWGVIHQANISPIPHIRVATYAELQYIHDSETAPVWRSVTFSHYALMHDVRRESDVTRLLSRTGRVCASTTLTLRHHFCL